MCPFHIFLAILVTLLWGFNFVIIKLGLQDLPPFLFVALRYCVAVLPVFFVKKPKTPFWVIFSIGFTLGILKFSFMFLGMHLGVGAGIASLLLQSHVIITVLMSSVVFKTKITVKMIVGILISFAGIAIIGVDMHQNANTVGVLLLLLSALAWSISNICTKFAIASEAFSVVVWTCTIVPIPMFVLSYIFEGPDIIWQTLSGLTVGTILCVLYTAAISTWIGASLWAYLLCQYPASTIAPYSLLIPVFGMFSGWLCLGETLSIVTGGASLLILLGLFINQWSPYRKASNHPLTTHKESA